MLGVPALVIRVVAVYQRHYFINRCAQMGELSESLVEQSIPSGDSILPFVLSVAAGVCREVEACQLRFLG